MSTEPPEQLTSPDIPELYPHIKEAFGGITQSLDTSALALLENARKIALLLGFHHIDTSHILLARLLSDYQTKLSSNRSPDASFESIIRNTTPGTTIMNLRDKTIPPTKPTEILIYRAINTQTQTGQKTTGTDIIDAFTVPDYPESNYHPYIPGGNTSELPAKIRKLITKITPRPIFGQSKTA